jgi:4-amino-4-deoxychorismate lyase
LRYILRASASPNSSLSALRCGIATTRWATQPQLAGLKLLARTEQVLAAAEAAAGGWDDVLMLDSDGHVISSSRANLFMLFGEKVATPCLDRCGIAGTRRELLLTELLPAMGCAVEIRPISLAESLSADAVVTTNSVSGVTPISQLGESKLWSDAGSDWVTALQRAMAEGSA